MQQNYINTYIQEAESLFNLSNYTAAYHKLEIILPLLEEKAIHSEKISVVSGIAGWASGILTGGIGIEDLFVIPAVKKGVEKLFGSDPQAINSIGFSVIIKQIECVLNSNELLESKNSSEILIKFAQLYAIVINQSETNSLMDLYFPSFKASNIFADERINQESYLFLVSVVKMNRYDLQAYYHLLYSYLKKKNDNSELYKELLKALNYKEERQGQNQRENENTYSNTKSKADTYYEILGLNKNASREELIKAYRELIKKYHPDKFASLSREFQEIAERKAREINEAYNYLLKIL